MSVIPASSTSILTSRHTINILRLTMNSTFFGPSGRASRAWRKQRVFIDITAILNIIFIITERILEGLYIITYERMENYILIHLVEVIKGEKLLCIRIGIVAIATKDSQCM